MSVMLYIPKRGSVLDYCWVAARHIVSIYFQNCAVYVELDTKRTLRLEYESAAATQRAVECFHAAMLNPVSKEEADKNWPAPTGGDIVMMK
jgi:hypothetical protein